MKAFVAVVISKDLENGGFLAHVPAMGTCGCWAPTVEQAFEDAVDAAESFVGSYVKHGETVPAEFGSQVIRTYVICTL
jgi:predicted RNase H-like HicB family nuclease